MKHLTNKQIVLGVTGGIAAYKSADLVRRLIEAGAKVHVVMTESAKAFVTPLTFQALSGNPVHEDLLDPRAEAAMGHIELARWADCILIAPTSADFMAKLAHGHGNDLLSTLCLASKAPIAIAPAMNQQMWADESTQANLNSLINKGLIILGPDSGSQACGDEGFGRMLEPTVIVDEIADLFQTEIYHGINVLITAGPTQENIDPVRYISNRSSGKMGYAIASALAEAGAKVTLISGPVHLDTPKHIKRINVISALEMADAVTANINSANIFISTAAVADFRCKSIASSKIAKSNQSPTLELIKNPDIVAEVAELKPKPFVVGFAAETDDVVEKAKQKLADKNLDMIAANQVGTSSQGFDADNNALTVLWKDGQTELPLANKSQIARGLITIIKERYESYEKNSAKDFR